jgi:hypothetical protein
MTCCGGGVGEGEEEDMMVRSYDIVETTTPRVSVIALKVGTTVGDGIEIGSEPVSDIVLVGGELIESVALEMTGDPVLVVGCVVGPPVTVENVQPDWTVECNVFVLPTTQDTKVGVLVGG